MHVDNNQSMILNFAVKIYKKQTRQKSNGGNGGVCAGCGSAFLASRRR